MYSLYGRLSPVDNVPDIKYDRDMALTHADFFRHLPAAVGEHTYRVDGLTVHVQIHDGTLEIRLGEEQERRIALMCIEFANVSFLFRGVTKEQQEAFKAHFDLRFQRGGG